MNVIAFLSLLVLILLEGSLAKLAGNELVGKYNNSLNIFKGYTIHWSIIEDEHIIIALEVNTMGWIGFGIGEDVSGSMGGADMLTGFVNPSGGYIKDRWAEAKGTRPKVDLVQDWELVAGWEDAGSSVTVLELRRALLTDDLAQDRPLVDTGRATKIIGAWGETDDFGYHAASFKHQVNFFRDPKEPVPDPLKELEAQAGVQLWTILNEGYQVPAIMTTYTSRCFNVSNTITQASIIAMKTVVDKSSRVPLHHSRVLGSFEADCKGRKMMLGTSRDTNFILPQDVGIGIGWSKPESFRSLWVDYHFHNPNHTSGAVDTSGFVIYYTPTLRKHEAGILQVGDPAIRERGTKLLRGLSKHVYNCPASCTRQLGHPIIVYQSLTHMHMFGHQMYLEQFREGQSLGRHSNSEYFDFASQDFGYEVYQINPGDHLKTACIYDSDGTVKFGHGSQNEMCIHYLWYYPRSIALPSCGRKDTCGSKDVQYRMHIDDRIWGEPSKTIAGKLGNSRGRLGNILAMKRNSTKHKSRRSTKQSRHIIARPLEFVA